MMPPVSLPADTEPEVRHGACWYGRRTPNLPPDITIQSIVDGELLYCAHPMLLPIVGYDFDTRNCESCDYFKPRRISRAL
jgi:hypothetical protein